ncbi:hypothetical protein MNBD_PLANCTO02-572, partial [hydrothermal vent metagenome]
MKKILQHSELNELMERLCEDRLSATEMMRIEEIVISDRSARQYYLNYIQLHGTLHWDAAGGLALSDVTTLAPSQQQVRSYRSRRFIIAITSVAALLVVGWFLQRHYFSHSVEPTDIVVVSSQKKQQPLVIEPPVTRHQKNRSLKFFPAKPPRLMTQQNTASSEKDEETSTETPLPKMVHRPTVPIEKNPPLSMVSYINNRIQQGWEEGEVTPSPTTTDEEWVRRLHLDITGKIPSAKVVASFVKDKNPEKSSLLVNELLESPGYVSHFTTIWANLLIGRDASRDVNRASLEQFLSQSFSKNRTWNQMAADLISAEGDAEENGAANFLLANLNNQAVPATAITARLFLGTQVQCTQCHDHPFNDWKQDQFWELNCFFKQTKKVRSSKKKRAKLISQQKGGPTFYENRRG